MTSRRFPPSLTLPQIPAKETLAGKDAKVVAEHVDTLWRILLDWQRFLRALADYTKSAPDGLPAPHAFTHKGGDDSVAGTKTPTRITLDADGDVGTAGLGFAPIDHEHPAGSDLASLSALVDLGGGSDVNVSDVRNRKLLESILEELESMEIPSLRVESDGSFVAENVERLDLRGTLEARRTGSVVRLQDRAPYARMLLA